MPQTPTTWLGRTLVNPDTTGFQGEQEIIGLSNGNILVVFADDSATSPSEDRDITAVIYDAQGGVVRAAFQLNSSYFADTEGSPAIGATNDGGFMMAFEDTDANGTAIRVERFNASGNQIDNGTVAADPGAGTLNNPRIAVNQADNSFFVTWERNDSGNNTIRGAKFDANLNIVGVEATLRTDEDPTNTNLDGDPLRQDTAILNNGTFVTVFDESDIFNSATDRGIEFRISTAAGVNGANLAVTGLNGIAESGARVAALSDGGFVVVWLENEGSGTTLNNNIKYRVYEANGTARTAVLTAADSANNHSGPHVVGMDDGTFFIGWEDNSFNQIEGQLYNNANGATIGSEIDIDTLDTPVNPEFGKTTDGRILVTYQTIASGNDVQFKIFDPRDATITADPGDGQVTSRLGSSTVIGSSSSESLLGQGGSDTFVYPQGTTGSGNVDTINGGGGTNTFSITTLADERLVDLSQGVFALGNINTAIPIAAGDIRGFLTNIQNVSVAGAQDVRGDNNANVITATGNFTNDLYGLGGIDTINGGGGNDVIDGGTSADLLTGGAGDDDYYLDVAGDQVFEAVAGGTLDRVFSLGTYVLAAGQEVEQLATRSIAGVMAINLSGNEFGQRINGNSGVNVLDGRGGTDIMQGFGGSDDYYLDSTDDQVLEAAGGGALDRVFNSASFTLGVGQEIEWLATRSVAGVTAIDLAGNAFAQQIVGNNGVNILDGRGGTDILQGFGGNDDYYLDSTDDQVLEGPAGGALDRIFTSATYTIAAGQEVEFLATRSIAGVTAINLSGNTLAQQILGNNGVNLLDGKGGTDILQGFGGNDDYYLDSTDDQVLEAVGGGALDRVFNSASFTLGAGQEIEWLATRSVAGVTAIDLTGNATGQTLNGNNGANILIGFGGADTLFGQGGNDRLYGGTGNDILNGGANSDIFAFNTALDAINNVDTIQGYSVADDVIWLDDAIFAGLALGNLAASAFTTGAAASDALDRIIYNNATGALSFDADGSNAGAAVQFANIGAGLAMANTEFFVV